MAAQLVLKLKALPDDRVRIDGGRYDGKAAQVRMVNVRYYADRSTSVDYILKVRGVNTYQHYSAEEFEEV
jgi:hypothetical protein